MKVGEIENVVYLLKEKGANEAAASVKALLDKYESTMYMAKYYSSEITRLEAKSILGQAGLEAKIALMRV